MRVLLFEDAASDGLAPVALLRPAFELLCGHSCLRSRIRSLNAALTPKGSDDDLIPVFESPDRFLVFVAGADGLYSVVFPSWSAGAHGNNPVHMAVASNQACEVPFATS